MSREGMDDLYYCVGFILAFLGMPFVFNQFWWVFGGFMIFIMPVLAKEADKHSRHTDDEFWID